MSDELGVQIAELVTRYEALQRAVDEHADGNLIRRRAREILIAMNMEISDLRKTLSSILKHG